MGSGRFVGPKTLEVRLNDGGVRTLVGDQVFLNVGTRALIPGVPGLEATSPLTHIEALELDTLPAHLIVIGGGYAGLELAQAYRRFGSDVTVIEAGPQLMGREDLDASQEIRRILNERRHRVFVSAELLKVSGQSGKESALPYARIPASRTSRAATSWCGGAVPNTVRIGLEEAGIELDSRGYVRVNDRLETSAPDVWALGECAGSPQFTHISEDDFRIVRDNLAGGRRSTHDRLVPYCMFTDPPLAHVGLSEREAERQGVKTRVARLPMSAVLRAQATGEKDGLMKVLVGESDDRILGFTMIGAAAGEVMAVVQTAMMGELPYTRLRDAVLAHPTFAEGLGFLFSNVPPPARHKTNAVSCPGRSRQSLAPSLSRSRCAACLARLPQIAMLHHRLARLLVWSANMSVQFAPSHALMLAKSSSHTHCLGLADWRSSNRAIATAASLAAPGDRRRRR